MILVGTPAYNGMVHIDFVNSIINMEKESRMSLMCIGNESLITRARNTIISYFFRNIDNFTHLLFLDGDIGILPGTLTKMLQMGVDVLGVPVPLKGYVDGKKVYNFVNKEIDINEDLMEAEVIGSAVLLLSNKVIKDIINRSKTYMKIFNGEDTIHYEVFKTGVSNNIYYSEDYFLCKDLREIGYKIYALKNTYVRHNGIYCFD